MAGRLQNTHDGGIVERRLRPIYDWLDNGHNKKALQEAEKVLKKSPSLQSARALKALALLRLGRAPEARNALQALKDEKPSDDTTLQAMTICYRETQQLDKVCEIYEVATKAEPLSEELHSHLFMAYVRVGDHRAQQRAAMSLYKFAPKNPYYFWAVMSIVLQAKSSEDATKRGILLALAQRMVDNFIAEKRMEAEQEARLYVMILELQHKWEDILRFIESPLYIQLVPGTIGSPAQECIPYLKKLGQWRRINLICKSLLLDHPDRWDYYMPYLDSIFELMNEEISDDSIDNTPEKAHEFICQLVENMTNGKTLRGPYLARLELYKRLAVNGDPKAVLGSGVALCVEYLRAFAHKPCAIPDLRPFLAMLSQEEREENCSVFLKCLNFDQDSEPNNYDDIQRHISCLSAWRLTAPPLPSTECLLLANNLRAQYTRCLRNGLVNATLTEFCAADGYAVLAAHHYFYAANATQSSGPIIEALSLLELVLHHSPSNFHVKLLLIMLYHLLGVALGAENAFLRLEAKHVQLLSLGWLHAARLPAAAPLKALQLLADTSAFHSHHAKDSVEHLTYAYKYGTFEKLVELMAWSARLAACSWCAHAARERALLGLLAGPGPILRPHPLPKTPTDNRDLNVIVNYEPPQYLDPDFKSRTFDQELAYLRLKDGLVTAIGLCVSSAENKTLEDKKQFYEQLKTCVEAFSSAMEKCREIYCRKERVSISAPFPSRIIAFVTSPVPYRELYSTTFSMVGLLSVGDTEGAQHLCSRLSHLLQTAENALGKEIDREGDPLWHARERLECVSNYLEFIGIISYLLGECSDLLTPPSTKKNKKKTNHSPDELKTHQLLNSLNEAVQTSISYLETIFDSWPIYKCQSTLEEDLAKLNINSYSDPVEQNLKNSVQVMVSDMKNILNKKSKYLKSLVH